MEKITPHQTAIVGDREFFMSLEQGEILPIIRIIDSRGSGQAVSLLLARLWRPKTRMQFPEVQSRQQYFGVKAGVHRPTPSLRAAPWI